MTKRRVTLSVLQHVETQGPIYRPTAAMISSPITPRDLAEIARWRRILRTHGEEDAEWSWSHILRGFSHLQGKGLGEYEHVVLRCIRKIQAVMILETAHHVSRGASRPLIYVEYLATAPWNRPSIQTPRLVGGCGRVLIQHAVARSESLGYGGLVGLHSLPAALAFYVGIGFKDFGPDPGEDALHYLELNA